MSKCKSIKTQRKYHLICLKISVDDREDDKRFIRNWNQFYQNGNDSDKEENNH